ERRLEQRDRRGAQRAGAKMRRNIELKARCRDLDAARAAAIKLGASPQGILVQTDTYFHVPHGRLKVREIEGETAELIYYARADSSELRDSHYEISPVAEASTMIGTMAAALGVR